jgi:hypothetical protein
MDDFRTELTALVDAMRADGIEPAFLVVDLDGIDYLKRSRGSESADNFRLAATGAISAAAGDCDTFSYGDERVVAILPGFSRLKTFALIDRLQRALPLLGQSYDCALRAAFDVLEYDAAQGVPGIVAQLAKLTRDEHAA